MKELLLLIAFFVGCSFYSTAQNIDSSIERALQEGVEVDSTTNQRILQELETIRGLQQEARTQRMKAVHYRDSLNKTRSGEANSSEYSVMSDVERNTRFNFWANGWNLIGVFALLVAIWSLIIARKTFTAQNETEKHTQKAPIMAQIGIFRDLPRHFYRNLVCSVAAIIKYRDPSNLSAKAAYPSESNLGKLKTLPEEFILPIDVVDNNLYMKMHEAQLLFRNYNIEISTASMHLARYDINETTLASDFDNLLFKPLHLTSSIYSIQDKLYEVQAREEDEKRLKKWGKFICKIVDKFQRKKENIVQEANWNAPYTIFSIVQEHLSKFSNPKNINLQIIPSSFSLNFFSKKGFNKSKFELFFGPSTKPENGILRSVANVLKYKKADKNPLSFLVRERNEKGEFKGVGTINVEEFKKYFELNYDKNKPEIWKRFNNCFSVTNLESFKAVYESELKDVPNRTIVALFKFLKPYYGFFSGKDSLDFTQLVFLLTMLDAVLELPTIGMVNYK